jgi:hypothetical protein
MPQVLTIGADLLARRKFAFDYYPCPVQGDPEGVPAVTGENGSVGPLGTRPPATRTPSAISSLRPLNTARSSTTRRRTRSR